jgi:toll-like receptor 13
MVFSTDFVRSEWCQFELSYCFRHVMDYDDKLLVVCLGDVLSSDDMTSAMMAVLMTTPYLQWDRREERFFWGHLEEALFRDITRTL